MSYAQLAWAFDAAGVRPRAKLILISLADGADMADVATLHMDRLCRFALCDAVQADRDLGALERRGLIDRSGERIRLKVTNAVRRIEARHAE